METEEIIDLFDHPELIPDEVQAIIDKYSEDWGESYEECAAMLLEMQAIGYSFDYYLDAVPFNLTKIV